MTNALLPHRLACKLLQAESRCYAGLTVSVLNIPDHQVAPVKVADDVLPHDLARRTLVEAPVASKQACAAEATSSKVAPAARATRPRLR